MDYFISYQHSGNTLVRYFIELLTKRPTIGHNPSCISDRFEDNFLEVDKSSEPVLIKRHEISNLKDNDRVVFLLRDYKDCIKDNFVEEFEKYHNLLKIYKEHSGRKIIITYDEVMCDIIVVCKKILDFLGIKDVDYNIDIDFHKKKCLSVYRNSTGKKGYGGFFIEKLSISKFTYELWKAGSLLELGIYNRFYSIKENIDKIRNHVVGYAFADNLYFRPKKNEIAVMFFYNGEHFWTHLRKKEFMLCFPELEIYIKKLENIKS